MLDRSVACQSYPYRLEYSAHRSAACSGEAKQVKRARAGLLLRPFTSRICCSCSAMASVSAAELLGLSPPPAAQQRPPTASPVRVSQKAPAPSPRPPVASTSAFRYSATPEPAHVPQQQVAKPAPNTVKGKGKATGPPPSTSLLRRLAGPSDQKAGLHRDREVRYSYVALCSAPWLVVLQVRER